MIEEVIKGIIAALKAEFGYEVHRDTIEQEFEEPCFFINMLSYEQGRMPGKRTKHDSPFVIQYFPESEYEKNKECTLVMGRMFECLEVIDTEAGKMRGSNLSAEIKDEVLNFNIDYKAFTLKSDDSEKMDTLQINTKKEG